MCGICGIAYRDPRLKVDATRLRNMTDTMVHRGPDDSGIELFGNVGLGHRRLSIIDLSASGRQPMTNEDGSVWIVFNGEIYNFAELREGLTARHQFQSRTDTEVLVHLYEEQGANMLSMLDGMFALAIYDRNSQSMMLARDPFGIKPLFLAWNDERLVFGSEIKPLLASDEVSKRLDTRALNDFFDLMWVPAPHCIFADIRKLEPAHYVRIDLQEWRLDKQEYWHPEYAPVEGRAVTEWADDFAQTLQASVRRQLVSDVPLGTFLSGGIDSSLVTLFASQASRSKLKTFTIDFEDQGSSESDSAHVVVDRLNTDAIFRTLHHDSIDCLSELVQYFDEPFADSSMLPTAAVSRVAREYVTVALSGDGGDELFAGYRHYGQAAAISRLDRIPHAFSGPLFQSISRVLPSNWRATEWLRRLAMPPDHRRLGLTRMPARGLRTQIIHSDLRESEAERAWFLHPLADRLHGLPPITQLQMFDLLFYLPNDMLVKVDRASMACSLETRVPLLTPELAKLAFTIPEHVRFNAAALKPIPRRIVQREFGSELASKPKHGFSIPRRAWLHEAASRDVELRLIDGAAFADGLLDKRAATQLFADVRRGTGRWRVERTEELFALLVFDAWWNRYRA